MLFAICDDNVPSLTFSSSVAPLLVRVSYYHVTKLPDRAGSSQEGDNI